MSICDITVWDTGILYAQQLMQLIPWMCTALLSFFKLWQSDDADVKSGIFPWKLWWQELLSRIKYVLLHKNTQPLIKQATARNIEAIFFYLILTSCCRKESVSEDIHAYLYTTSICILPPSFLDALMQMQTGLFYEKISFIYLFPLSFSVFSNLFHRDEMGHCQNWIELIRIRCKQRELKQIIYPTVSLFNN